MDRAFIIILKRKYVIIVYPLNIGIIA